MFWVPKKSFYGEWMRKRDFSREIVAAACLSLSCPRLPIATFIDGFNTVFHLGLSWCVATLILGLYFNFCFIVYVVRKRHRLLGAPSPHVLLQGNLKKKEEERKKERKGHTGTAIGDRQIYSGWFPSWEVVSCFIDRRWGWHDQRRLIESATLPGDYDDQDF